MGKTKIVSELVKMNTKNVIEYFKGCVNEWYLLKGLLIADHNMNPYGKEHYEEAIDTLMIAERMDEITYIEMVNSKTLDEIYRESTGKMIGFCSECNRLVDLLEYKNRVICAACNKIQKKKGE